MQGFVEVLRLCVNFKGYVRLRVLFLGVFRGSVILFKDLLGFYREVIRIMQNWSFLIGMFCCF